MASQARTPSKWQWAILRWRRKCSRVWERRQSCQSEIFLKMALQKVLQSCQRVVHLGMPKKEDLYTEVGTQRTLAASGSCHVTYTVHNPGRHGTCTTFCCPGTTHACGHIICNSDKVTHCGSAEQVLCITLWWLLPWCESWTSSSIA